MNTIRYVARYRTIRCNHRRPRIITRGTIRAHFHRADTARRIAPAGRRAGLGARFGRFFSFLDRAVRCTYVGARTFDTLRDFTARLGRGTFVSKFYVNDRISFLELSAVRVGWC